MDVIRYMVVQQSCQRPENGDTGTMNGGIAGCCRVREGPVVNTLVTAPGVVFI